MNIIYYLSLAEERKKNTNTTKEIGCDSYEPHPKLFIYV